MTGIGGSARWISPVEAIPLPPAGSRPTHLLRTTFTTQATSGTLHATAHGIYEAFLDGERIGDIELAPGFTEYRARLQVQTYELALDRGEHTLTFEVSDGWYRGKVGIFRASEQWGETVGVLAQLDLADGTTVVTGEGWKATATRHLADPIDGETVDLRDDPLEGTGAWAPVLVGDGPGAELVTSPAPPVRRIQTLQPVSITTTGDRTIVDLGQNMVGWIRLRNPGASGATLTLTYGEELGPDGDVTQVNLEPDVPFLPEGRLPAGQVDHVIANGDPDAVFEPRHGTRGFRYVRIEGLDHELGEGDLKGVVVHTDLMPVGSFTCSDPDLNRLHEAAVWSFRGNAVDVPTDCPVRERAAWTADWQIFLRTAEYLYDVRGFSEKWLVDLAASQWDNGIVANQAPMPRAEGQGSPIEFMNGSAGWGDACTIVPWQLYREYGDTGILRELWPTMLNWAQFVTRTAAGARHPIREARHPQPRPHDPYLWDTGWHFGEWLEPGGFDMAAHIVADKGIVATAYFRHSTLLMSMIADTLGKPGQALKYGELSENVRQAWMTEFLNADGRVVSGKQADCVRALAFELVDDREAVAEQLVDLVHDAGDHVGTGFLATVDLLPTLAEAGHGDLAYTVLRQRTNPSWLGMLDAGATTMWERWEGWTEDGYPHESHNHYSKGAVISFLHGYVGGVRQDADSINWERSLVAPVPGGGVTSAETTHRGIRASWAISDGTFTLRVTVPDGSEARVLLPSGDEHVAGPGGHVYAEAYARTRPTEQAL
jgi:alpha-L-rhamnosidase